MSLDAIVQLVLTHGYLVLFVAIALECAALPIPGELVLLTFGGLSMRAGLDPVLGVVVAACAVVVGDSFAYWAGRLGGAGVLSRVRLGRRWTPGSATIVFGRFVVGARALVAPMAGARRLPFGRYLAFDFLGGLIWAALFVLTGFGAGAHIETLQRHFSSAMIALEMLIAVAAATYVATRLLRRARMPMTVGAALLALAVLRSATSTQQPAVSTPDAAFIRPLTDNAPTSN